MRAFALNCTLKPGPEPSSTDRLLDQIGGELARHGVTLERERVVDDVGFSLAANAVTYWMGEAMQTVDLKDLDEIPAKTTAATRLAVANAVHLAATLATAPYPKLG